MWFQWSGDAWSWIIWFIFLAVFFMIYPRLMISQIMWRIDRTAKELEDLSEEAKGFIIRKISERPDRRLKEAINRFFEFFIIQPVSLDPFGLVKKLEHILKEEERRFKWFVDQVMPRADQEKKACIRMGLAGGITLYDLAKIVRHYVELVRKTKNIQIALILQMQLPQIEKLARALFRGTKALTLGIPIGDGIGPLVGAKLIGRKKPKEYEEDVIGTEIEIDKKHVIVLRAKGPGGRTGHPERAIEKIVKKRKISKIITIDAAAKLEGEKTGAVAEGVGVAFGGSGVERSRIEDLAVKYDIPLDSIVVKMSAEEAIMPMKKAVADAVPRVLEAVRRALADVKGLAVIVCVGNSSGIGNTEAELEKTYRLIQKYGREKKKK
ncbi:MAG: DUF1512 domain-containing protein [Candidatus Aenigmatarchaeota archaeon]|nr:MAG: DUF1512 domain-containing protein [Candidatus Aenigmarchaeota archaeon]